MKNKIWTYEILLISGCGKSEVSKHISEASGLEKECFLLYITNYLRKAHKDESFEHNIMITSSAVLYVLPKLKAIIMKGRLQWNGINKLQESKDYNKKNHFRL